eukprot:1376968-Pyramimonas_sp.AAC.1
MCRLLVRGVRLSPAACVSCIPELSASTPTWNARASCRAMRGAGPSPSLEWLPRCRNEADV